MKAKITGLALLLCLCAASLLLLPQEVHAAPDYFLFGGASIDTASDVSDITAAINNMYPGTATGTASYAATTHTLTLEDFTLVTGQQVGIDWLPDTGDLTIQLVGDNRITVNRTSPGLAYGLNCPSANLLIQKKTTGGAPATLTVEATTSDPSGQSVGIVIGVNTLTIGQNVRVTAQGGPTTGGDSYGILCSTIATLSLDGFSALDARGETSAFSTEPGTINVSGGPAHLVWSGSGSDLSALYDVTPVSHTDSGIGWTNQLVLIATPSTVEFNSGGGSGTMAQIPNVPFYVPWHLPNDKAACTFTGPYDQVFSHWEYTLPGGGKAVYDLDDPNSTLLVNGHVNLTAMWTDANFTAPTFVDGLGNVTTDPTAAATVYLNGKYASIFPSATPGRLSLFWHNGVNEYIGDIPANATIVMGAKDVLLSSVDYLDISGVTVNKVIASDNGSIPGGGIMIGLHGGIDISVPDSPVMQPAHIGELILDNVDASTDVSLVIDGGSIGSITSIHNPDLNNVRLTLVSGMTQAEAEALGIHAGAITQICNVLLAIGDHGRFPHPVAPGDPVPPPDHGRHDELLGVRFGQALKNNPDYVPEYLAVVLNPAADEGWVFTGWYLDAACTRPFDLGTVLTTTSPDTVTFDPVYKGYYLTLYAGWAEKGGGAASPDPNVPDVPATVVPPTGDAADPGLWTTLFGVTGAAFVGLAVCGARLRRRAR